MVMNLLKNFKKLLQPIDSLIFVVFCFIKHTYAISYNRYFLKIDFNFVICF